MSLFGHEEEESKHLPKPIRLFYAAMKKAFGQCCTFNPTTNVEEESWVNDTQYKEQMIILAIRNRAMEAKMRREKAFSLTKPNLRSPFSPNGGMGELIKDASNRELSRILEEDDQNSFDDENDDKETFYSACSCFSQCRSNTESSILSSTNCFCGSTRRLILEEFCHCEGWPFGLCKKALLLPPLPPSPTQSWLSQRGILKM